MTLFGDAADRRLERQAPLAARLRPRTLDEIVGQEHLVAPGAPLRVLAESDRVGSSILWGPAGTGKTTLARLLADTTAKHLTTLSATAAGVKDVREAMADAERRLGEQGQGTMLFIDEVHRFSKSQQDVLLPAVEDGLVVLVGATTENPFFEVNPPLLSRASLWRLHPLTPDNLRTLVRRGLDLEGAQAEEEAIDAVVAACEGDARAALTTVEVAAALARARGGTDARRCTMDDMSRARDGRLFHQGADEHYDQISALIKSVRGSDPDAGLYWMARMIEAGEDPRFLARRMVDPGQRGHRAGRSPGAPRGRGRRPGRRVRGAPGGGAQPGRGGHLPGPGAQVQRRDRGPGAGPGRRALRREPGGPGPPARRPLQGGVDAGPRGGLRLPARRPLGGRVAAVSS